MNYALDRPVGVVPVYLSKHRIPCEGNTLGWNFPLLMDSKSSVSVVFLLPKDNSQASKQSLKVYPVAIYQPEVPAVPH